MSHGAAPTMRLYAPGEEPVGVFTWRSMSVSAVAACGGLLFGYDLGVTGGVTGMPSFLAKFYPQVIAAKNSAAANDHNKYCTFDDQQLQLWTSSMFLAGAVAGLGIMFFGNRRMMGKWTLSRKATMMTGGACFFIGALLQALGVTVAMLYIGRILLGIGIGFANQSVPLYISEMAPPRHRGKFNIMFQLATTIGIFSASLINYGLQDFDWGWRLSLGLACVPALIFFTGSCLCPDTPTSMLYLDPSKEEKARQILQKMRGVDDVSLEFKEISANAEETRQESLWGSAQTLYSKAHYKQAMAACLIPFFQQFTGMNAIMFYAPQIFQVIGLSINASLMNTLITNTVNLVATGIAIAFVDKFGRKVLFYGAGMVMFLMQIVTGILIAVYFGPSTAIPTSAGKGLIACICFFVIGFACSWGPLGWLVPSEIHTAQTRTAGQASTVFINFIASFIIGQFFNSMLCSMQYGVFFFFAGWVLLMTFYVAVMLPETKGLTLESMMAAWEGIPKWRIFALVEQKQENNTNGAV